MIETPLGQLPLNAVVRHPRHGIGVVYSHSTNGAIHVLFAQRSTDKLPHKGGRLIALPPLERIEAWQTTG